VARHDIIDQSERPDRRQPTDRNEPTDKTEPADPTLPMDSTEPTEPIESTEFRDPMDRREFCDLNDQRDSSVFTFTDPSIYPWCPASRRGLRNAVPAHVLPNQRERLVARLCGDAAVGQPGPGGNENKPPAERAHAIAGRIKARHHQGPLHDGGRCRI
jgi:hypothetical protein